MAGEVPRKAPFLVVIGGGIGAGKSSVTGVFASQGYVVISADDVGREILAPGSAASREVAARWPEVIEGGAIDRAALARVVFADATALEALETITHPQIVAEITHRIEAGSEPIAVETPVMGLLGGRADVRVAVVAPRSLRLARAVARGGEASDVERRMQRQPSDHEWRDWADVVVDNSGPWATTERFTASLIDGWRTDD